MRVAETVLNLLESGKAEAEMPFVEANQMWLTELLEGRMPRRSLQLLVPVGVWMECHNAC